MLVGDDTFDDAARVGRGLDVPAGSLEATSYLDVCHAMHHALVTLGYRLYPYSVGLLL